MPAPMNSMIPSDNLTPHAVEVVYRNVPSYLHFSAFYRSLTCEDDSVFEVPANCFWTGETICTDDDFRLYLQTLLFWGLSTLSFDALRFCFQKSEGVYSEMQLMHCYEIMCEVYDDTSSQLCKHYEQLLMSSDILCTTLTTQTIYYTLVDKYNNRNHAQILFDFHAISKEGEPITSLVEFYGPCWDELTCEHAARSKHFDCVQFFIDNGCVWDLGTCYYSAMNGRVDILRNACNSNTGPIPHKSHGWPEVAAVAALCGHICCLQFIHDNQFPWDAKACTAAVFGVSADLTLQFLVEHGCPMSADTLSRAACQGSIDLVRYLLANGCAAISDTRIVNQGSAEILQLLLDNGLSFAEDDCYSALSIESLKVVLENGGRCENRFLLGMADTLLSKCNHEDNLPFLAYLIEDLLLPMSEEFFECMIESGVAVFVKYLIDVGCPFVDAKPFGPRFWEYPQHECDIYGLYECIVYTVEHGWNVNVECVRHILLKECVLCAQYLRSQGVYPEITESIEFIALCEKPM